jgi:hypothetical protein
MEIQIDADGKWEVRQKPNGITERLLIEPSLAYETMRASLPKAPIAEKSLKEVLIAKGIITAEEFK